jgi:hypothetical protein
VKVEVKWELELAMQWKKEFDVGREMDVARGAGVVTGMRAGVGVGSGVCAIKVFKFGCFSCATSNHGPTIYNLPRGICRYFRIGGPYGKRKWHASICIDM